MKVKEKQIKKWLTFAKEDLKAAEISLKENITNIVCFHCQQAVEKILKAAVVKNRKKHAMPIHNLGKLALETNFSFSEEQLEVLDTITSFNIFVLTFIRSTKSIYTLSIF